MFKKISLPLVHWRRLPPVFYLSLGALLGVLLTAFVLGARAAQKNSELMQEFGTALAQLAAREAVDASISHDLVSMHAIMQEVQAQPRVLMAAVHDLEQSLLVQAGQPQPGIKTLDFSAPIPLHDSIAGHVTITLNAEFPGEAAVRWTLLGTCLLLVLMLGLALYDTWGDAWELREIALRQPRPEIHPEPEPAWEEPNSPPVETPDEEPTPSHSDLVLALPNRARLEKQLSEAMFADLIAEFDGILDRVLAVYGGSRVGGPTEAGIYCLRFTSSESAAEAAFRAVCCAHLVYELNQRYKIRFQVVAEVCRTDSDVKLAVSDTGIFIQAALLDPLLEARLDTRVADDGRVYLAGFKAPFASLLERQREQLLAS